MSIVARVFVVLNLIASIVFMVFAMQIWTAKTKWQKMYEREREKNIVLKKEAQDDIVDLSVAVATREGVIKRRNQRIDEYVLQVNRLRDAELELKGQLAKSMSEAHMQQALNEELTRELGRRSDELVKLKGVLLKQQQAVQVARDNEIKARNEKAEIENELNAKVQMLAQVQRDKRKMEEDLALQNRRIEGLIQRGVPIVEILGDDPEATQPFIPDAVVLAVKPDLDMVMLSVGSEHGVKPGYRFTVSRGDQYIGKVQVEKVFKDMSSARMLPKYKRGEPAVHDEARTRVLSGH